MQITSLQNARIKYLVKLREDKRQRQQDGLMLVEGWDEINLALSAGYLPRMLVTCPELITRTMDAGEGERLTVSRSVFDKISFRDNPDGWMGAFPTPHRTLQDLRLGSDPLVIVAESVEKPGNLGAILRTADAAGVTALLVCDPRVDLYSPNVVRASRGTLFSVPAVETRSDEAMRFLRAQGLRIVASTPAAQQPYTREDLRGPLAIAVGTEDEGLTEFWLDQADAKVLIPMIGKVNSLNVSIAAALIVYEAVRQRTV